MDGLTLHAILNEVRNAVVGARVDRIHQPHPLELRFSLYRAGQGAGASELLINLHTNTARLHLTKGKRENPPRPPQFCQLLRRHLEGSRIEAVEQLKFDRVVFIRFAPHLDRSLEAALTLLIELLPPRPNLALLRPDGSFLAVHRPGLAQPGNRPFESGELYEPPSARGLSPLDWQDADKFLAALQDVHPKQAWQKQLVGRLQGIGPTSARALLLEAGMDPSLPPPLDGHAEEMKNQIRSLHSAASIWANAIRQGSLQPALVLDTKAKQTALPLPFAASLEPTSFPSWQEVMDHIFEPRTYTMMLEQIKQRLQQSLSTHRRRLRSRIERQTEELLEASVAETHQRNGEILTAFLYQVPERAASVELPDFYDENQALRRIELDPSLSPAANAQRYFRLYSKAKRRLEHLEPLVEDGKAELAYIENLLAQLEWADDIDTLTEMTEEMQQHGYIKASTSEKARKDPRSRRKGVTKKDKTRVTEPLRIETHDGWVIFVGRNNRQNDDLTMRRAKPDDLWFHARNMPGSHVVLQVPPERTDDIPEHVIEQAAQLAAWFSKGRSSTSVPIDMTERRHVWKPRGARPGFVLYGNQQTLQAAPSPPPTS